MKYEVRIPIEGYASYIVDAESEKEAREIAYDGEVDVSDVYWEHADTDHNPVDIYLLEEE